MSDKCKIYKEYCPVHNFIHGAEAEELREGLKNIIDNHSYYLNEYDDVNQYVNIDKLEKLLEKVDARDSLAYLDAKKKIK